MIQIQKFIFNNFIENTYIVWDDESKSACVIDPGCADEAEESVISDFIDQKNLKLRYLINTHCHLDHILGVKFIKEKFNPTYFASEKDLPLLENSETQADLFGIKLNKPPLPDVFLTEETGILIGETKPKFIYTPGHTPGEYSIYFKEEKFCITGDVLFKGTIGRTDLWGGNYELLMSSIKDKILALPDETIIYAGHGEDTRIGLEKIENPFVSDILHNGFNK
jgi:hydroxyacylglutathione hydrolase